MGSCKEFDLDDVMAVTAIPVDDYNAWGVAPLAPVISDDVFEPPLGHAIVIGLVPATDGGDLIPIRRDTGKAKDSESDAVAGRKHTVSIDCEVDDREGDAWVLLRKLERTESHLILTFRGNTRGFVAATKDSYRCEVNRDGAKTQVQLRVENLSGIQLIV